MLEISDYEEAGRSLIVEWFFKYGYVASWGVLIDNTIELGDLRGLIDQINAFYNGWTD